MAGVTRDAGATHQSLRIKYRFWVSQNQSRHRQRREDFEKYLAAVPDVPLAESDRLD